MRGIGGSWRSLAAMVAVCAWLMPLRVAAQQPLPAFQVETSEGRTESIHALTIEPQWLIVYVTPNCPACNRLLDSLAAWQSPAANARTVVIVAGEPVAVRAYVAARHGVASAIRLYADVTMQAARALALSGSPSIVAIRRGQIEWVLTGVLNDPEALEPAIRAWVEY